MHLRCCFFQAEDGIRDIGVTGVQTCALPILSYVPGHGVFRAPTSANGDLVVSEQQLRNLAANATSIEAFRHGVDELLGAAWDADLEVYRHAGDGSPVTWLHQVV